MLWEPFCVLIFQLVACLLCASLPLLPYHTHYTLGIVGTAKAVLSESSSDQNQAFGMSLLACSWGLGLVIGPALSGISADPLGQYNISLPSECEAGGGGGGGGGGGVLECLVVFHLDMVDSCRVNVKVDMSQ